MPELSREQLLMAVVSGRGSAYLRGIDLSSLDLSSAGWLVGADLREANLSYANLSRANLKHARLEHSNLNAANLVAANLEGAALEGARLAVTNLKAANLRGANLQQTRLVGAIMTKADLRGANLENADLEGANLEGANLSKAKLNLANLTMANLKGANLEEALLMGTILDENMYINNVPVPSHGFAGSISHVQLADLVQFLCLSRSNLLIRVESSLGHGTINLRAGRVYHAQTGEVQGEEAFFRMLHWEKGRFETLPLVEEGIASIDAPPEHLLFETMRMRDEKESSGEKLDCKDLIQELEEHLPIPISPSKELLELIWKQGKHINLDQELEISDVHDSKDSGEILCSINAEEETFVAPLSHIKVRQDHPLTERILSYQHNLNKIAAHPGLQ